MTPPPPRPRAFLFDWDNTLAEGWPAVAAALNAVFRRRNLPEWTPEQARARVRGSARDSFPVLFGDGWEDDLALYLATFRAEHLRHLRAMPGAVALLAACAHRPCALVSNKTGALLRVEVGQLGWTGRFGAIIGAGDAAADKPDPAPLHLALSRLGLAAGPDIWFVGDTALDMRAARAAGCRAVLLGDAAHDGGVANAAPDAHYAEVFRLIEEIAALA